MYENIIMKLREGRVLRIGYNRILQLCVAALEHGSRRDHAGAGMDYKSALRDLEEAVRENVFNTGTSIPYVGHGDNSDMLDKYIKQGEIFALRYEANKFVGKLLGRLPPYYTGLNKKSLLELELKQLEVWYSSRDFQDVIDSISRTEAQPSNDSF